MLTEERFSKIVDIVNEKGSVTVQELMKALSASESTIRRDLASLDKEGKLTKVHGGAVQKNKGYSTKDKEVLFRKEQYKDEKNKIAEYAAGLIEAGDFVYIDAGTTTERMIDFISEKHAVYITNAITHARKLAERGCVVHILGGEFKAITEAIVGEEALDTLEKYTFTKGFWGTNAIDYKRGFSTPEIREAMVKKKSMENCQKCYVLADESKFEKMSCVTFAPYEQATIITTGMGMIPKDKSDNIINLN